MIPDSDLRDRVTQAADAVRVDVPSPEQALRKGRGRRLRRAAILPIVVALAVGGVAWAIVGLTELGRSKPGAGNRSVLNPAPAKSHGIAVGVKSFRPAGAFDIYVVDPKDGSYVNITPDDAQYFSPAWSPDGSQLAVARVVRHGTSVEDGIYVMNADGTGLRRVLDVTTPGVMSTGQIQWSPDGTRIAFVRSQAVHGGIGVQRIQQLMVMEADGSNLRAVTQPEDGQVTSFSWSPDGARIVYTKQFLKPMDIYGQDLAQDLYVVPMDGGQPVALTNDGRSMDPAWSPDGTQIAFVSRRERMEGRRNTIYLMNADGTGRRVLTTEGTPDSEPTWSPDGSAIAFIRSVNIQPDTCRIMSIRPDGSGEREILGRPTVDGCFIGLDW
jgi:Tol biopolymer transport system component